MHLQREDPFGKMIYDYLENDNLPNETKMAKRISIVAEQFVIKDGILYHIEIPHGAVARDIFRVQLFLPQALRHNVVLETHQQLHLAVDKMCMKLKLEFWWPQMMRDVQRCIDNCSVCQADRKLRNPYQPPLKSPKCPNSPGESWVIDHVGPWEFGSKVAPHKPKYVLVCVDAYSGYVELITCRGTTAFETANVILDRLITHHSYCRSLRHDKGAAFT